MSHWVEYRGFLIGVPLALMVLEIDERNAKFHRIFVYKIRKHREGRREGVELLKDLQWSSTGFFRTIPPLLKKPPPPLLKKRPTSCFPY